MAAGPSIGSPIWWAAAALAGFAALATRGGAGRLVVVLAFAALGVARGTPDSAPVDPPDLRVWELEVSRGTSSPSGVPVRLVSARSVAGAPPQWVGDAPATLRMDGWPVARGPRRGDRVIVQGRAYAARRGLVLGVDRPEHALVLPGRPRIGAMVAGRLDRLVERARSRLRQTLVRGAPGASHGLLLALALGDREHLPPELREAFSRTGTAHLLAISGLHVGCLCGVLVALARPMMRRLPLPLAARLSGLPDRLAVLAGLAGAAAYVVIAGAPVSSRRALVMLGAISAAWVLDRPVSAWNALAAAVIVVAWVDPSAVSQLGFQLSVASVAGLVLLLPHRNERQSRWGARRAALGRAVAGSAVATAATAPLTAMAWGQVPVAGLWVNPVVIPLLGAGTVPPLLLGGALGVIHPALGEPLVRVAAAVAELGCRLVRWFAEPDRCPVLHWEAGPEAVAMVYGVAAAVLLAWGRR